MRVFTYVLVLFALFLIGVASWASEAEGHTTAESVAVADQWWAGHHCDGRTVVLKADDLGTAPDGYGGEGRADGRATGLVHHWHWSGSEWVDHWHLERCEITIRTGLTEQYECWAIWHEITHLALVRADHDLDPLRYDHPGPEACRDHGHLAEGDEPTVRSDGWEPAPITAAQRRYRERKHRWYHTRSKHPDRIALAMKWHDLAEAK